MYSLYFILSLVLSKKKQLKDGGKNGDARVKAAVKFGDKWPT